MKTQTAGVFKFLRFEERFQKAPFSKCFTSTPKRKAGVFKFLRFVKRFLKAPFSWRISVDEPPSPNNKAPSWNLTGEVWTCLVVELREKYNSYFVIDALF